MLNRIFLAGVAIGSVLGGATPALAVPANVGMLATSLPSDAAVQRFYARRQNAPLWFSAGRPTAAAQQLVSILRRAPLDGLSGGPELATRVTMALQRAGSGNPADVLAADQLMSSAWVLYSQAIEAPTGTMEYGDPYLAPRQLSGDAILAIAEEAPSLADHIRSVSDVNPIYAPLRNAAWTQMQATGDVSQRLLANLDRARVLPNKGKFIIVDVATQRLTMYEQGRPVDSMKVIVGQPTSAMQTPLVASRISYTTFNPYWHVPPALVRRIIARNVMSQGEGYLKARGYEVVDGYTRDARVLSGNDVDWKAVAEGRQEVWVRQSPSRTNSMGMMKFQFPNKGGIYLHDTPQKELFAKADRTLSNGCIRLEDAKRFASWLLQREPRAPSAEPELYVQLPQSVPVYVTYLTARADGSQVTYVDDAYGLDDRSSSRLAAR